MRALRRERFDYAGGGFLALLRYSRLRTRYRFGASAEHSPPSLESDAQFFRSTSRSCHVPASDVPAIDKDMNLFSLHRRSINRRSHELSAACWEVRQNFRERPQQVPHVAQNSVGCNEDRSACRVQERRQRVFQSTYFSPTQKATHFALGLKRAIIAPDQGIWEAIFYFRNELIFRCVNQPEKIVRAPHASAGGIIHSGFS